MSGTSWEALLGRARLYAGLGALWRDDLAPAELSRLQRELREASAAAGLSSEAGAKASGLDLSLEEAAARPGNFAEERSRLLTLAGCPPYEGAYVGDFARLQELADISGFYAAVGMRAEGERPDHVAVECEYAALLCVQEALATLRDEEGAARCRDARAAFHRDHLGTWLARYAADLGARARLPLYPAALSALHALVRQEAEELGIAIHERTTPERDAARAAVGCGAAP